MHERRRYYWIDAARPVAAFFVVLIHVSAFRHYDGSATFLTYEWYRPVLNIAVPFFFFVSGYLLLNKGPSKILTQASKTLTLFVSSVLIYLFFDFFTLIDFSSLSLNNIAESLRQVAARLTFSRFLDGTAGQYHLWFLSGLTVAILALTLLVALKCPPWLVATTMTIPWVLQSAGTPIIESLRNVPQSLMWVGLGFYFASRRNGSRRSLAIITITSALAYVTLSYLNAGNLVNVALVIWTIALVKLLTTSSGSPSLLSKFGEYSFSIYVLHVLVLRSCLMVLDRLPIDTEQLLAWGPYPLVMSIVVYIISCLLHIPFTKYFLGPMERIFRWISTSLIASPKTPESTPA